MHTCTRCLPGSERNNLTLSLTHDNHSLCCIAARQPWIHVRSRERYPIPIDRGHEADAESDTDERTAMEVKAMISSD